MDFDDLVREAERELGITVGDDQPLDSTREPPCEPSADPSANAATDAAELPDNAEYRVWYGTNRKPLLSKGGEFQGFSSERDETMYYGKCRVFVPKSHKVGSTGSSWLKRKFTGDDRLSLKSTEPNDESGFWRDIKKALDGFEPDKRDAVVFIHGYNFSFENAALRAAQIGFDLSIKTAMAFFSWPSKGTYLGYTADESTIEASEDAIKSFLVDFSKKCGARKVHLIIHSMGNRGVMRVLSDIVNRAEANSPALFGQIILAAPDVDINVFKEKCACYSGAGEQTTLYVSQRDRAVGLSGWIHNYPRVGLAPPLFVSDGIDTINVTNVDLTSLGHGYIAEARAVLADIFVILTTGNNPAERNLQGRRTAEGKPYWEFRA